MINTNELKNLADTFIQRYPGTNEFIVMFIDFVDENHSINKQELVTHMKSLIYDLEHSENTEEYLKTLEKSESILEILNKHVFKKS